MKKPQAITIVLALFLLAEATAPCQNVRLSKKQLQKNNICLQAELDSLKNVVEEVMSENDRLKEDAVKNAGRVEEPYAELLKFDRKDYSIEASDSLLNEWYKVGKNCFEYDDFDLDTVKLSTNIPDSVYIARLNAMHSFIPLSFNDVVRNYIILYTEKRKGTVSNVLGLSSFYMPVFEDILNRYGMPLELKALTVIESALNPTAVSRAGAKGMWQFMYTSGRRYGLTIDSFVDERYDFVKETDAAARYLRDHYAIFGDWLLTIASYNCGAGNVMKAIRRSGGKTDFWEIYQYLPRETRGYVPAFIAVLYAMTYYKEHGIVPKNVEMPAVVDTLTVKKMLHFKQLSEVAGIPMDVLHNFNPQYIQDIIPGDGGKYTLKLPLRFVNAFLDNEDSAYVYKADSLFSPVNMKKVQEGTTGERTSYTVRSGDTLGSIARRNHCTVSQLKKWNNLKSDLIRVGQKLKIYR